MEMTKKITGKTIVLAVCFVVICVCAGMILYKMITEERAQNKFESLAVNYATEHLDTEEGETGMGQNIFTYLGIEDPGRTFDWEKLRAENKDIYAWIYIPGTKIDYPILQHPENDEYYLRYNLDGSKGYPGCIYTEKINAKDFSDHNTLIYGHNMKNGTMFRDLHKFSGDDFFKENRYVFIYTPDELLVYDVFAAYEFSSDHILRTYDCSSENGFARYISKVYADYENRGNFREDVHVMGKDHIITLSTCIREDEELRFLVQAVLVEYEPEMK